MGVPKCPKQTSLCASVGPKTRSAGTDPFIGSFFLPGAVKIIVFFSTQSFLRSFVYNSHMKKEKHPVYYAVLAALILLLAVGAVLLVCAVSIGNTPFLLGPARSV